jgi:hypothetical protein
VTERDEGHRLVNLQTIIAIALAVAAAAWLARRWWKHGFEDEAEGCSGCTAVKPLDSDAAGLPHGGKPHGRPGAKTTRSR